MFRRLFRYAPHLAVSVCLTTIFALPAVVMSTAVLAEESDLLGAPEVTISTNSAAESFYLRADLGYAGWRDGGTPDYRSFDAATGITTTQSFDDARFARPWSGAAGIGYRFTDILRADLTVDGFESRFGGGAERASPCAGQAAGTSCSLSLDSRVAAIGLMANGYVDFGTVAGFTPYLGAGAGATHLRWNTVTETETCLAGAGICAGGPAATNYSGEDDWRFAYAVMAGVSYDLTDRIKIDLGYRYSQIAGGDMFAFGAEALAGARGAKGSDDGLSRHEVRAGMRVMLW